MSNSLPSCLFKKHSSVGSRADASSSDPLRFCPFARQTFRRACAPESRHWFNKAWCFSNALTNIKRTTRLSSVRRAIVLDIQTLPASITIVNPDDPMSPSAYTAKTIR